MTINIIAAVSSNGIIGNNGHIPWHISEDMHRFRDLTTHHPVIMGRKTRESLGRALPNRNNVVITRGDITFSGTTTVHSLSDALSMFDNTEDVFIIGGSKMYEEAIGLADRMYITKVCHDYEGDSLFPQWDTNDWEKVFTEVHHKGENYEYPFIFEVYERRYR